MLTDLPVQRKVRPDQLRRLALIAPLVLSAIRELIDVTIGP